MPDPTMGLGYPTEYAMMQGHALYPDQNLNTQAIQDDYLSDINKIAKTFQVLYHSRLIVSLIYSSR